MTYHCKNRRTHSIVERHDDLDRNLKRIWQAYCVEHKTYSRYFKYHEKTLATKAVHHPWEWCEKCKAELESAS